MTKWMEALKPYTLLHKITKDFIEKAIDEMKIETTATKIKYIEAIKKFFSDISQPENEGGVYGVGQHR
jgi:hypothetical protein